jgi:hypothetical protein
VIFFVAEWIGYEIGNGLAGFELPVVTDQKGQAMGQQIQGWRSASGQRLWLSMLIETMEEISRPERRAVPCDDEVLAALQAQLARPASASLPYASPYSLRN